MIAQLKEEIDYFKSLPGIVAENLTRMVLTGGISGLVVILFLLIDMIS